MLRQPFKIRITLKHIVPRYGMYQGGTQFLLQVATTNEQFHLLSTVYDRRIRRKLVLSLANILIAM
jgi:hypothetical protein